MDYHILLDRITGRYADILGDNCVGIYVHGSICLNDFAWHRSDIDFIVVVRDAPSADDKLALLRTLHDLEQHAPPKGFEMSVVLARHCNPFLYPTPFELHYSGAWTQAYERDPLSLCRTDGCVDPDLAAHFTVIKHAGLVWYGAPIADVFGDVPRAHYIDSLLRDIDDCMDVLESSPESVILSMCRIYAYLHDGAIYPKAQAICWATEVFPQHADVLADALQAYLHHVPMSAQHAACRADLQSRIMHLA